MISFLHYKLDHTSYKKNLSVNEKIFRRPLTIFKNETKKLQTFPEVLNINNYLRQNREYVQKC